MDLNNKALQIRKRLGEDATSPIDIFSIVQFIDKLTLVFYPLGEKISGICYKGEKSALIAINSDMTLGRQRYSLAHELYHYYFDAEMTTTISSTKIGIGNDVEKRADVFASYLLMPSESLYLKIEEFKDGNENKKLNLSKIIDLEQYYGMSHMAMLIRLKEDGYICQSELDNFKTGVRREAETMGYDTKLYNPSSDEEKIKVLGNYIKSVEKLYKQDKISNGKYESYLLDAFREDLVFGVDNEGEELVD